MLVREIKDYFYGLKQLNPLLGYPVNCGIAISPVFIIGSGRSGNTLLRRILNASGKIYIPPETYVLGKVIQTFKQNRHLPWASLVHLCLAHFEYHKEFDTFEVGLRPLANELVAASPEQRSLVLIIDRFYDYHARYAGITYSRWGDKTPLNVFRLNAIYKTFPSAQFIHIVRDGCDVVSSYVEAGLCSSIEHAADRWLKATKISSGFVQRHSNQCIEIKYEFLVNEPERTVSSICTFLDIKYFPDMLNCFDNADTLGDVTMRAHHASVLQPISNSSIGKGRKKLTLVQRERLRTLIDANLNKYGYASCLS